MKTTKQLKKYSSFALALALALPATSFAAATEVPQAETNPTLITDSKAENQTTIPYSTNIEMALAEDGKQAIFDITLTKNLETESNLKGFIYLVENSNLENIKLVNEDGSEIKSTIKDGVEVLNLDLKATDKIRLVADIKEGKTSRLFFDLGLADDTYAYISSQRVYGEIEQTTEEKLVLTNKTSDETVSVIKGKFVNDDTIQWTDYLLNTTNQPKQVNQEYKPSGNLDTSNSKIKFDYYSLTGKGLERIDSKDLDFGNIQGLEINPNSLVKISFQTKANFAKDGKNIFSISEGNQVVKEKPAKSTDQSVSDEEKANELCEKLEDNSKKMDYLLKEAEKSIAENQSEENNPNKKDSPAKSAEKNKTDEIPETKTAEELTANLEDGMEKIEKVLEKNEESLSTPTAVNKAQANPAKVETIVLTADESNPKQKVLDGSDIVRITNTLNANMDSINNLLVENGIGFENPTIMTAAVESTTKIPEAASANLASQTDKQVAEYLINKLEDAMKKIDDLVKTVIDPRAVDKLTSLSISNNENKKKKEANKETPNPELEKELEETSKQIEEVLRQIELSYEIKGLKEKPDDLAKIQSLISKLEKTEETIEKQLEQTNDPAKTQFNRLVEGFSDETYKELKNVATVTLDPQKPLVDVTDQDRANLKREYKVLSSYLENLELRKEIFTKSAN